MNSETTQKTYIHPSDVHRYASLIHEFSVAEVGDIRSSKPSPVANRRIHRLDDALDAWVGSYVTSQAGSLMPTFVLDAARLIQAHAWGETFSAERAGWTLTPMISNASAGQRRSFPDRAMKHQISSVGTVKSP